MKAISSKTLCIFMGGLAVTLASGLSGASEYDHHKAETEALRDKVKTIVVIYAENRAFDNVYGHFPGADGLNRVTDERGNPRRDYIPRRIATAACCRRCRKPGAV